MVSNKEYSLRIDKVEKESDILFSRIRKMEDEHCPDIKYRLTGVEHATATLSPLPMRVAELEAWQNRMRGALIVFPAICTGISTIAALVAIYYAIIK